MVITSKSNELIKKISSLQDKKFRKKYGEYLVEGIKPVNECISAGKEVTCVVCTPELESSFKGAVVVSEELFKYISSELTPQGVMAVVKIPDIKVVPPEGSCILLDKLQDPGNLGTIIRTANAAGYNDIYLINCTDPFSPKAVRASMSGIFFVNLHVGSSEEVFNALTGVPIIAADMDGEDIFAFTPPKKYCLCIGNEGNGISEEVKAQAAFTVKIPMRSSCESLNAAVSAAISMYTLKNK
jgi:TrmH family RNA methyltransferase